MQSNFVRRLVLFVAAMLAAGGAASATIQRTFVASYGNDAYPCNLLQPCRTFGAAIVNTNSGGDIVVLDSGGYGAVIVTKPVSIIVPSGIYAGIPVTGGGDGVVVNVPGGNVSLRGLIISSQGGMNGVRIQQANKVMLEDVKITGFWNSGNGKAILHNATTPNSTLLLRNVVLRDGDQGLVIDATAGQKSVTVADSMIEGYSTCVAQTDDANVTVQDTTIADCGTGVAVNQTAAEIGYAWLALDRVTIHRSYPGGAVKITNNATNRSPTVSISDSKIVRTNGISTTNGAAVSLMRSTLEGCGPAACMDASGTNGFVSFEVSKSEIKHGPGGIRMALDGTMGGVINLNDSRVTSMYPNEAVYLRGMTNIPNLLATRSTIDSNKRGIVIDTQSQAKLMGNHIVFNSAGGLIKVPAGTNQFITSAGDNYVANNGWESGSPPDEVPVTVPLR